MIKNKKYIDQAKLIFNKKYLSISMLIEFKDSIPKELKWLNEPKSHQVKDGVLVVKSDGDTDFWQRTHYGFRRNTGHCLMLSKKGDFTMETKVSYAPKEQYDQAGLIVYLNEEFWIKTSIEFEKEGPYNLGAVVTNFGYSDWSTQPFHKKDVEMEFKIQRKGNDFFVYARAVGEENWQQLRICHFHIDEASELQIGVYCCSPKEGGFESKFNYIKIE